MCAVEPIDRSRVRKWQNAGQYRIAFSLSQQLRAAIADAAERARRNRTVRRVTPALCCGVVFLDA